MKKVFVNIFAKFFAVFASCFVVFTGFSRFSDVFGPVRTHSDLLGHIRIHLDAFGCVWERLTMKLSNRDSREKFFENLFFEPVWRGKLFQMKV